MFRCSFYYYNINTVILKYFYPVLEVIPFLIINFLNLSFAIQDLSIRGTNYRQTKYFQTESNKMHSFQNEFLWFRH